MINTYSNGEGSIVLTSPRTSFEIGENSLVKSIEEAPRELPKEGMKSFWTAVQDTRRPGTYFTGDGGTSPLGHVLIDYFKNFNKKGHRTWKATPDGKNEYKLEIPELYRSGFTWNDVRERLLQPTKWEGGVEPLSTDSYLALLKQGNRPGYSLRYSPNGMSSFNNQSFANRYIQDLLDKANNGEIPKKQFVDEFNKWVKPYNGMEAKIIDDKIIMPHPYVYKKKQGGKMNVIEQFKQGGSLQSTPKEQKYNNYYGIMEKVAEQNYKNWGFPNVDYALLHALNDNTYNYRGYYNKYPNGKGNAVDHWTDEFKTVYHPTFSKESKYSGKKSQYNPKGIKGGSWLFGKFFIPSKDQLMEYFKKGGGIHIKEKNKGKFTSYCGGKVTDECIQKGKNSSNPAIRKRATFAANARKWKHKEGGKIDFLSLGGWFKNTFNNVSSFLGSDKGKSALSLVGGAIGLGNGISNSGKIADAANEAEEAVDAQESADRQKSFTEKYAAILQEKLSKPDIDVNGSPIHTNGVNVTNEAYNQAINTFNFDNSKYNQMRKYIKEQAQQVQNENSSSMIGSVGGLIDSIGGIAGSLLNKKSTTPKSSQIITGSPDSSKQVITTNSGMSGTVDDWRKAILG